MIVGAVLLAAPSVFADDFRVLVIPDNIVTETSAVDSFIYNATAEFFADDVVTLLNTTDYIKSPTVSETRVLYKNDPTAMLAAKNLTNKFRTNYNVDYVTLKKLANRADAKYALLMTSHIDAENYILRRTVWDFLNIPGASVIDPAYKISTYAVLVDTENNKKLWSNTYYKTISTCENRIITRGPSPQTEQLQKIKDYSKYISPQIAQSVQQNVLPADIASKESTKIDYDMGNIDNVFTKKYRHLGKETNKVYQQRKEDVVDFIDVTKDRAEQARQAREAKRRAKQLEEIQSKLEVEAKQYDGISDINNTRNVDNNDIKDAVYKKKSNDIRYPELINIEIKKKKKSNLFGEFSTNRPELRDYD